MAEKGVGLLKTALLSPATAAAKTAGDVVLGGVENLVTKPLAVGVDYLTSLARSAATFGEKSPGEFRTRGLALTPAGVKFGAQGFREGLSKSIALLQSGVDPDRVGEAFDLHRVTYDSPILNAITHGVYNTLKATVKPWYGLAMNMSLYSRAVANAAREGLSGAARTARVNELLAHPTDEMSLGALQDAEYATLTNRTTMGAGLANTKAFFKKASENPANDAATRSSAQFAHVASEYAIPFTGVPSAIGGVVRDYSPVGAGRTLRLMVQAAGKGAPDIQGQLATGAARSLVGTGLIGLGYYMARKGLLTGSYPTNPGERARWQAEGKEPYSFLLNGEWHSLTKGAPISLVPLIGADIAQYTAHQEEHGGQVSRAGQAVQGVASLGKVLTEQSFLKGMNSITSMISDPEHSGQRAAASALTEAVPTVFKQIGHGLDPTIRQTNSFGDLVKNQIPGAASTLPAKLDQFGAPMTRGSGGGLTGVAREMLDITHTHAATPSPATAEMDRLGVGLPSFGKGLSLPGQPRASLSPSEYTAKVQEFGPIKQAMVEAMINTPSYQQLPDDEKKDALENVLRSVQSSGNAITKARKLGATIPPMTPQQYLRGTAP